MVGRLAPSRYREGRRSASRSGAIVPPSPRHGASCCPLIGAGCCASGTPTDSPGVLPVSNSARILSREPCIPSILASAPSMSNATLSETASRAACVTQPGLTGALTPSTVSPNPNPPVSCAAAAAACACACSSFFLSPSLRRLPGCFSPRSRPPSACRLHIASGEGVTQRVAEGGCSWPVCTVMRYS